MKIALFGYGKMGKTIERIALERGHEIVAKIDIDTEDYELTKADVAIDFSAPDSAFNNINKCFNNSIPIISGTTGWLNNFDEAIDNCKEKNGAFIYASNFSLGVNLFFELNTKLAKMMSKFKVYDITLEERFHQKIYQKPRNTS